jgi:transcriptional regulator with GAF, ATPase, and Fis domain
MRRHSNGEQAAMPDGDELVTARAQIQGLEAELAVLRSQAQDVALVRELRAGLTHAAVMARLGAPTDHSSLLRQTVDTAINVLNAGAGSLYVVDTTTDELVFQVALPAQAQNLVGRRLPLGHGLAGWVAATGQAIAVADVQQDPRWAADVASGAGYAPKTMVAAPLHIGDRVIGVIQVLDKAGGLPFGAGDLQVLGLFANQGAIVIEQSQRLQSLGRLLHAALASLLGTEPQAPLASAADDFIGRLEQDKEYTETMEIAGRLAEIAHHDDAGRRLCLDLVAALAAYLNRRSRYGL